MASRFILAVACALATPSLVQAQQCTQADEDRAFALYSESRTDYQQGRFEDAIDRLEHAYTICPIPVLLYNLARSHEANGDLEMAIDVYERFLRVEPETEDRAGITRRVATLREQLRTRPKQTAAPSPIPFVVAGAGVLGLAAGVVLGVLADATAQSARDEPVHLQKAELAGQADDLALAANTAFIIGGVLALAGTVWAIVEIVRLPSDEDVALMLDVGPTGASLAWRQRF